MRTGNHPDLPCFLLLCLILAASTSSSLALCDGLGGSGGDCNVTVPPSGVLVIPATYPDGQPVTSIAARAFYNNSLLTSVIIPDSVTNIGNKAFSGCNNLANVTMGNGVISVGHEAFYGCDSLTSIVIPNSVASIGDRAFYLCYSLSNFAVAADNHAYSSTNGVLFDKNQTTLIQYPRRLTNASYVIPISVTTIGYYAFAYCPGLTNVVIGNGVTGIGDWAFQYCSGLTRVVIPNSVTNVGGGAFEFCYNLTRVVIGNSVTIISDNAFSHASLQSITIPDSVTNIGNSAFADCTSLTNVVIGNGVANIGVKTFAGCRSVTSVVIGNGVASIGDNAFSLCFSLTNVVIGPGVTNIGYYAFGDCPNLTGVFFRGDAPSFGSYVFDFSYPTLYYLPGTIGWTATGRPTGWWVLPNPTILTHNPSFGVQTNAFGFRVSWAKNVSVVVEACTNLAAPDWSPVSTNTLVNGWSYFSDPEWTNYPSRIYRVRQM